MTLWLLRKGSPRMMGMHKLGVMIVFRTFDLNIPSGELTVIRV